MREAAHIETEKRLEEAGWTYSHEALINDYRSAGTVSEMQPRNGYEHCRVHCGKCVTRWCYQITHVYKRPISQK